VLATPQTHPNGKALPKREIRVEIRKITGAQSDIQNLQKGGFTLILAQRRTNLSQQHLGEIYPLEYYLAAFLGKLVYLLAAEGLGGV
jgi:hypothetical protein